MLSLNYIMTTLLTFGLYIFILRLWMQYIRASFYNPFTQFIVKITQPILAPLKQFLPTIKNVDTSTLLVLYILGMLKLAFIIHFQFNGPIWDSVFLFYAFYPILHAIGHLIFWLLLFRAILSWIERGQSGAEEILAQLTDPLVQPIRRIVPPLGNIDFSFMIVVFILLALNLLATELFGYLWIVM